MSEAIIRNEDITRDTSGDIFLAYIKSRYLQPKQLEEYCTGKKYVGYLPKELVRVWEEPYLAGIVLNKWDHERDPAWLNRSVDFAARETIGHALTLAMNYADLCLYRGGTHNPNNPFLGLSKEQVETAKSKLTFLYEYFLSVLPNPEV